MRRGTTAGVALVMVGALLVALLAGWLTEAVVTATPPVGEVVGTIPMTNSPGHVVLDPDNGDLYFAPYVGGILGAGNVTVLSGSTQQFVGQVPIQESRDGTPIGIAVSATLDRVYVASNDGNITVIDGATNEDVSTFVLPCCLRAIAFDPVDNDLVLASSAYFGLPKSPEWNNLTVVSAANGSVVGVVAGLNAPYAAIALDSSTQEAFVTDAGGGGVNVVNVSTEKLVDTLYPQGDTSGVAYDSATGQVYIGTDTYSGNGAGGSIVSVDPRTLTMGPAIAVSGGPSIEFSVNGENGNVYYTTGCGNSQVWGLGVLGGSSGQVLGCVPNVPTNGGILSPDVLAYDGNNGNIYAASSNGGVVTIVSTNVTTPSTTSLVWNLPNAGWAFFGSLVGGLFIVVGVSRLRKKLRKPSKEEVPMMEAGQRQDEVSDEKRAPGGTH